MQTISLCWRRLGSSATLVGLGAALLAGCSSNPSATPAAPPAKSSGAEKASATPPAAEKPKSDEALAKLPPPVRASIVSGAHPDAPPPPRAGVTPPDGVWLKDEAGNEFYIEKMPRYPGKYKWIDDHRVNYMGVKVDVFDSDDENLFVKVYRVKDWDRAIRHEEPTAAEKDAASATYVAKTGKSDRLVFEAFDRGLPTSGQWRNGFTVADMNGDGIPDIVHCPPRKGVPYPVVFLGDGAGGWQPWRGTSFPRQYDYGDIAVGDVNGDGHEDLVLGIHLRGLRVLIGDGQGHFQEWSDGIDYQVPGQGGDGEGFSSRAVRLIDWNQDGKLDILALGEGPRLGSPRTGEARSKGGMSGVAFVADGAVIFLNQGDGTWKKIGKGTSAQAIFGDDLAVGDLNGDGRPDFVTASNRMARQDLVNLNTSGTDWDAEQVALVRPNAYVRGVTMADFDGDGKNDLAIGYLNFEQATWRGGIDLLFARPDGAWERRPLFSREGRLALNSLDSADIDGDGNRDIAGVDSDGSLLIFLGDGKGNFVQEDSPELAQPKGRCRGYNLRLADLDGDGRSEVIANFADEADAYYDPQRCLNGGALGAWKATARKASSKP